MVKDIITKELFSDIMSDLSQSDAYKKDLNIFFKDHGVDGYIYQPDCSHSVVTLLQNIFNDTNEIISTFCYEYEYGKRWKTEYAGKYNGANLSCAETVYDYLVRN